MSEINGEFTQEDTESTLMDNQLSVINELLNSNALLQARCKELESALKHADMFITNGIKYGFIRMPDDDTPDPAHDTPRIVKEAISTPTTDEHLQKLFVEWLGEPVAYMHKHENEVLEFNDFKSCDECIPLYAPKKVSE